VRACGAIAVVAAALVTASATPAHALDSAPPAVTRVLARRHELVAADRVPKRLLVRELPLGVVAVSRLAHRRACHLAVPEDGVRHLRAKLRVLGVRVRVRLALIEDDDPVHRLLSKLAEGR